MLGTRHQFLYGAGVTLVHSFLPCPQDSILHAQRLHAGAGKGATLLQGFLSSLSWAWWQCTHKMSAANTVLCRVFTSQRCSTRAELFHHTAHVIFASQEWGKNNFLSLEASLVWSPPSLHPVTSSQRPWWGRREFRGALCALCHLHQQQLRRWRWRWRWRWGRHRAKLGEEATGLQDGYCQDDLLSSAISCLKATAVTKAGPNTDGYQFLGILSYSHFTLMERQIRGHSRRELRSRAPLRQDPVTAPSQTPKGCWLWLAISPISLASQHGQVSFCSSGAVRITPPTWKCDLQQGCKPKIWGVTPLKRTPDSFANLPLQRSLCWSRSFFPKGEGNRHLP